MKNLREVVLSIEKDRFWIWPEYYLEFPGFSDQVLRPGCHPRKMLHDSRTGKAIVLVHGLTDSPFYMQAVADYFHKYLGYNVYLPLLQCHGLKDPGGMAGVSLAEWKKNVRFAIRVAAEDADRVSIGGFSTGGSLSLYFGAIEPRITGDIYLFSAALGIYGGRFGIFGGILEFLLRLPVVRFLDTMKLRAGRHPYRYDRVPLRSAAELARLILEIDGLLKLPDALGKKRVFAAWSEYDRVVNIRKIRQLEKAIGENRFFPYIIPRDARIDHARVVLKEPVYAIGSQPGESPLEAANTGFMEMMAAVADFESAG